MARLASGVSVVTTRNTTGSPIGITVSSLTSLSLEPNLILLCVADTSLSFSAFVESHRVGVSVLGEHQNEVALRYATAGGLKFADGDSFPGAATGVPLIHGAIAHLECYTHEVTFAGDHAILIGRVVHTAWNERAPMVSFGRQLGGFRAAGDD
ncbi:flavin reductase family protein [Streptomyces sp. Tu102]|uniref:flavin reductase family protein n=1 Tax=Streptomyces TaxID=1883 RepID=UPI001BDCC7D5|nr:flavin reductase family protein [Streptomyces sp. Tu102]MBT1098060.1 flavin reductase family protein [Streptomyces sp. Tu102]